MKRTFVASIAGLLVGLVAGAAVAGIFVSRKDAAEMQLRARYARALFRVAERCGGHAEAVRQWREAAKKEAP